MESDTNTVASGGAVGVTVFLPAPFPDNERRRSAAALAAKPVMENRVQQLSDIASDTRMALRVRWCGVMLLIDDSQYVLASSGGMLGIYRRATALSSYVVFEPQHPFVVLDTASDERFVGNPFVDDGLIGFYAGVAIQDPQGYAVGAICVTSRSARLAFGSPDVNALSSAAKAICPVLWQT